MGVRRSGQCEAQVREKRGPGAGWMGLMGRSMGRPQKGQALEARNSARRALRCRGWCLAGEERQSRAGGREARTAAVRPRVRLQNDWKGCRPKTVRRWQFSDGVGVDKRELSCKHQNCRGRLADATEAGRQRGRRIGSTSAKRAATTPKSVYRKPKAILSAYICTLQCAKQPGGRAAQAPY